MAILQIVGGALKYNGIIYIVQIEIILTCFREEVLITDLGIWAAVQAELFPQTLEKLLLGMETTTLRIFQPHSRENYGFKRSSSKLCH